MDTTKLIRNEKLLSEIQKEFSHISDISMYNTHVKIASQKYCDYLNLIPKEKLIINSHNKQSFAKLQGGKYIPNDNLLNQCFKNAKKGKFLTFDFMYLEVTLYALKEKLSNRIN